MTEAKKPAAKRATRKPAVKKAEVKTLAEQQLEAFSSPNGKNQALSFFRTSLPKLVTHYDHGEEAYALIEKWSAFKQEAVQGASMESLATVLPDLKRFVELVYGENTRAVLVLHWNGNLWDFFQDAWDSTAN